MLKCCAKVFLLHNVAKALVRTIFVKFLAMTIQLEITNPQDAELILSLVRRLNIPFQHTEKRVVEKSEREKNN